MVSVEIVAEGESDEETWDNDVAETEHWEFEFLVRGEEDVFFRDHDLLLAWGFQAGGWDFDWDVHGYSDGDHNVRAEDEEDVVEE